MAEYNLGGANSFQATYNAGAAQMSNQMAHLNDNVNPTLGSRFMTGLMDGVANLGSPLLGLGLNTMSSLIGNWINRSNWQMQNEYNSPKAQVERLREAGLNPALMYGHGQVQPAAGNIAQYNAPNQDITSLLLGAQLRNLEAQTEKTQSEADLNKIDALTRGALNNLNIRRGQAEVSNLNQAIAESRSRVLLNGKEMETKDAMIAVYGSEVSLNEAREAEAEARKMVEKANEDQIRKLTPALVRLHNANTALASAQKKTETERQGLVKEQKEAAEEFAKVATNERIVSDIDREAWEQNPNARKVVTVGSAFTEMVGNALHINLGFNKSSSKSKSSSTSEVYSSSDSHVTSDVTTHRGK